MGVNQSAESAHDPTKVGGYKVVVSIFPIGAFGSGSCVHRQSCGKGCPGKPVGVFMVPPGDRGGLGLDSGPG